MTDQPGLFDQRPVEPTPEQFKRSGPRDYAAEWTAYRTTEKGAAVAQWIERGALADLANDARTVSTKRLVEQARAIYQHTINNSWTAAIGDWLVAMHPQLASVIKRRARKAGSK